MKTASDRRSRIRGGVIGLSLGKYAFVGGGVLAVFAGAALGGPQGEQVARGSATFTRSGSTTVIEAAHNTVINYSSFNIGAGEAVQFVQPSASSRVLNRITGIAPTSIDGSLTSNGIVYIVNPAGVMFGKDSIINVGGIYAAAGNITDANFIAGIDHFTGVRGAVVAEGSINAGVAHLIGRHVVNSGVILGQDAVTMVAGDDVYIGRHHDRIMVKVNASPEASVTPVASAAPGVSNTGSVSARRVSMSSGDMYAMAISNTGRVSGRDVQIAASGAGKVSVSGTIDASGKAPGETGGRVEVLGGTVALDRANIDASGPAGGGTVLVGGDYQGGGGVQTARVAHVGAGTTIRADATEAGDGGRVIVWSDDRTGYAGHISARGAAGGDGGFAEVSGKETLVFRGTADLGSDGGRGGTLLLDPRDIIVAAGGTADIADVETFAAGTGTDVTIDPATITAVTNTGSSVTLQASQDVFVNDAIVTSGGGSGGDITMEAGRSILINADIFTDNGGLTLIGNQTQAAGVVDGDRGPGAGVITQAAGATINTGTGGVQITLSTGAGLTNFGSGNITLGTVTAGDLLVRNQGPTAGSGIVRAPDHLGTPPLITAGTAAFDVSGAGGGGGVGANGSPLRLEVTSVAAAGQSGGVFLDSPGQGFNVGGAALGGLTGVSTTGGGTVSLSAQGGITATEDIVGGVVTVSAKDGVHLAANLTASGATVVNTDTDNDAVGGLGVEDGFAVTTGGGDLTISGFNINLFATGAIDSGTGSTTILGTASASVGLGDAAGGMELSKSELQRITANGLSISSGGSFAIDNVEAADLANISGTITLEATGAGSTITFLNAPSEFGALTARATSGIDVQVDLTTGGATILDADRNADGVGAFTMAGSATLDSTGSAIEIYAGTLAIDPAASIVAGAGDVVLAPTSTSAAIGMEHGGPGFNILESDLQAISGGGIVYIGNFGGTHAYTIGTQSAIDLSGVGYDLVLRGGNVLFQNNGITGRTDGIINFNTGAVTGLASGTSVTIGGASGTVRFNTTGAVSQMRTSVANLGASTVGGNLAMDNGAGTLTISGAVDAGSNSVTITTDTIDVASAITANGGITLQPFTSSRTIGLNDASGAFNLSLAELANLNSTGTVTIGRSGGTGAIGVGSLGVVDLSAESYNLALRGGALTFNTNGLVLRNNGSLALTTGAITSAAAGTDITIGGSGTLTLTTGGAVGSGANPLSTSVANLGASTVGGNLFLDNGTGSLAVTGALAAGSNSVTITTDTIDVASTITANGGITLQPFTTNRTIGLHDASGAFNLSLAELLNLSSTGTVTIGRSNGTGAIGVGSIANVNVSGKSYDMAIRGGNLTFGAGMTLRDNGTLTLQTGSIASGPGIDVAIGGASGTLFLNTTGAVGTNINGLSTSIANLGASTVGGDIYLNNGTGALTIAGALDAGSNFVQISTDSIDVASTITADGGILLQPVTTTRTIGLNDAAGDFNLSLAELQNLSSTGTVTIGRANGTGAIAVGSAGAVNLAGQTYDLALRGGALTFNNGLTLRNDGVLTLTTGAITSAASGTDITIGGSGTLALTTSGAVGSDANPLSTSIANLGASTVGGDLFLDNGTGSLTIAGALAAGSNSVTITTDTIDVASTVTANGGITLRPFTASRTIGLADNSAGFALSEAELQNLASTGVVVVGRSDGTGAVTIGVDSAIDLSGESFDLTVLGGDAAFSDTLTLRDNGTLRLLTGAITASGGTDIVIGGAAGSLLLDTSGAVGSGSDALRTSVSRLAAETSAGGVFVENAGDLTLTTIDGVAGVTAGSGDVSLAAAAGNLNADTGAGVAGDAVALEATAGAIGSGGAIATATGVLDATAATGINISNTATSLTATLNTTTGLAQLSTTGDLATGGAWNAGSFDVASTDIDIAHAVTAAGDAAFRRSALGTIGVGAAIGEDMTISSAELALIDAATLTIGGSSTSQMRVDGVTLTDLANIGGLVTLAAGATGGSLTFENAASSFRSLQASAAGELRVNTDIATSAGAMALAGDVISFAGNRNIVSQGSMSLAAPSGIVAAGNLALRAQSAGSDLTLSNNLAVNGAFNGLANRHVNVRGVAAAGSATLNADTTGAGVGTVTVATGGIVSTGDAPLNIRGADLVLDGSLNAGTGQAIIRRSASGTIGLGAASGGMAISNAELSRIAAGSLLIGSANATSIDVAGVTSAAIANLPFVHLEALGSAGVVQFSGDASTFNALRVDALDGVSVNASLTTTAGNALTINADMNSTGPGALAVASNVAVTSGDAMNIRAADLALSGTLNGPAVSIAVTNNNEIALGGDPASQAGRMTISDAEFGRINAGVLNLGDAAAGGTITVGSITTGLGETAPGAVVLNAAGDNARVIFNDAAAFKNLTVRADNGIAVNADLSSQGSLSLNGDLDNAADGQDGIAIAAGRTLTAGGMMTLVSTTGGVTGAGDLTLSAGDLTLSSPLSAAGSAVTISRSGAGTIGIGAAAGDMTISNAELAAITAESLTIGGSSTTAIAVDDVAEASTAGIAGLLTLDALGESGTIRFENNASTFKALAANANDGIAVGVNVRSAAGRLALNGDANNAADSNDAVVVAEGVSLVADGGELAVLAQTGGIRLTGAAHTENVFRSTGGHNVTLAAVRAEEAAALSVTSQGSVTLNGADLRRDDGIVGNLTVIADALGNVAGATLSTGGAIFAREVTLQAGSDSNDTITIGGNITAAAGLTVRDAQTVTLAEGAGLTSVRSLNIIENVGKITLAGGAGTTNLIRGVVGGGDSDNLALTEVTGTGANLTIDSGGTFNIAEIGIAGGDLVLNLDPANRSAYTGTVGRIVAGTLTTSAGGSNDTFLFNGPITTSAAGGIHLQGGALALGGSITAEQGNILLEGATVLNADLTIRSSALNTNITFRGPLDGNGLLTVDPGAGAGTALFESAIGNTNAVRGLTIAGSSLTNFEAPVNVGLEGLTVNASTIRLNGNVASVGGVNFNGQLDLAASAAVTGSNVTFGSTVNSEDATPRDLAVRTTGDGVITFAGVLGGTRPLGRLTTSSGGDSGTTRLNADVYTTGGMVFGNAVILTSNVFLRDLGETSARSGIAFASTINSDTAGTPRALTLRVNTDGINPTDLDNVPVILFGGNVGLSAALSELRLNIDPSGADGRAAPIAAATIVGRPIDATGAPTEVGGNFALTFKVNDKFEMGFNEKLAALGSVRIEVVNAGAGVARIGDIASAGDISVLANSIVLRTREAGPIISGLDRPAGKDSGIDFVGRSMFFSRTPTLETASFAPPTFGTPTGAGDEAGTLTGFLFRKFGDITPATLLLNNVVMDLRSDGPTNTNVAQVLAGAVPRESQVGDVSQDTTIGQAQQEQLTQLGVFARGLGLDELLAFLVGRSLYDDYPERANPSEQRDDYKVAVNRLDAFLVGDLLRTYDRVFNRDALDAEGNPIVSEAGQRLRQPRTDDIREAIQLAAQDFRGSGEDRREFEPVAFMTFLEESPEHAAALDHIHGVREVFRQLALIGLTPQEFNIAKATLLREIRPSILRPAQLEALLLPSFSPLAARVP